MIGPESCRLVQNEQIAGLLLHDALVRHLHGRCVFVKAKRFVDDSKLTTH